jgi:DNA-binding MarR family transcriptional regulator
MRVRTTHPAAVRIASETAETEMAAKPAAKDLAKKPSQKPAGKAARRNAAAERHQAGNRKLPALPTRTAPPPPGQGKRGRDGYLGYLLRQAQFAARLTLERALAELDVTGPQFVVLTMLKAYPGLSGADVARIAFLTPQTVGVIIRNLEQAGAIRKTPHPVHGRVLQWTLTRRGSAVLVKCRSRVRALERRLAQRLSPRGEATVRRWLADVAADLTDKN